MSIDLQKDCATENFYGVELLIYDIVHKFIAKFGGDFEEYKSRAFCHFVRANNTFDKTKGACYTTWICRVVYLGLKDDMLKDYKAKKFRDEDYENQASYNSGLGELLADLQGDSETIVSLILETPDDLVNMIALAGGRTRSIKRILYKYLRNIGWSCKRIKYGYAQIEKALCV